MTDADRNASNVSAARDGRSTALRDTIIATAVCAVSTLLLVPVVGAVPGVSIDLSWPYTLADATARHIPFGRDMVFTMGPLSSLYTRFFLPDQRLIVCVLKAILVLAFCLGTVALSRRSIRWVALALPFLLANVILNDGIFLVMPWVIVPLATASWSNRRWHTASLLALSAVLGPLLLVKGTLAIPLAGSIGAAALVLARRSWLEALALPCAALAAIVIAWLATGQHLGDLPYFLRRESYVASGYTNAMSSMGDPSEIWAYLAGATVLLLSQFAPRRGPVLPTLTAAVILFVGFKAGFVRHDLHTTIAGGTMALLAFLMFLYRGNLATGIALVVSLAAGLFINANSHFWSVDPASSWDRMVAGVAANLDALRVAEVDPDAFRRAFDEGKAKVAAVADLPPTSGTVDLYPNDQELLLASNRDYYPRPVMQSYSAYTPELAFLNANHLNGPHAPQTVFFGIDPIDEHYPSMDDGPSWPVLLGQYHFRTYAQAYAVLDRVAGALAGILDPTVMSGTPRFGDNVSVPQDMPFVWAKMQFHPTLLGRIASALFKLPLLRMDVTTVGGQTTKFRIVPGMASAGFLLSPTVTSARDFVALRSTVADVLAGQRVTSIKLHEDGELGLWGESFDVQFAALRIPSDPSIDAVVLGRLEDGPPADKLPVAGECIIDTVGGVPVTEQPVPVMGRTVTVTGWGFVSTAQEGRDGGSVRIALTPEASSTLYASAERQPRPDVDANFGLTRPTHAGFTAQVNLTGINGPTTLRIVQDGALGPATCGKAVVLTHHGPA